MRFTVDGVSHEFDDSGLTFAEGRALEKATGHPFGEIGGLASKGSLTAIQALIWVALKRDDPSLRFSDLDDRAISDFQFEDESEPDPTSGEAA